MAALLPEIITNVLSRLPVKSLLRFRSVSKPWCAEIDDPYFTKLHLGVSTATSSNLRIIGSYENFLFSIDNDSGLVSHIETPFRNIRVCGSSNGLLLLSFFTDSYHVLCLFNPSTLKYLVLPDMPDKKKSYSLGFHVENFCLGYDAMHDDYKVFALQAKGIRVYNLKSNSWTMIKDYAYAVPSSFRKDPWGSYINGALHSILAIEDAAANTRQIVGRKIIALDIEAEACRFMPLPESMDKHSCYTRTDVLGGCLCAFTGHIYKGNSVEIWVMKEYGVKESWSMLLSVTKPPADYQMRVDPIFYSEIRNEVLIIYDGWKHVWYDLKTGATREIVSSSTPFMRSRVKACVGSLIDVGGMINHLY